MHSNFFLLSLLGIDLALASPEPVVTQPALLERQAGPDASLSTCSEAPSAALYFDFCRSYVADLASTLGCNAATAASAAQATCSCQSANDIVQCASSFCVPNNYNIYTEHYSNSLSNCNSAGITPTAFAYTYTGVGSGPTAGGGSGTTATSAASAGGATTAAAGSSSAATSSSTKNAGAVAGPPGFLMMGGELAVLTGFVLAWGVGFAGMALL